jgi:DNA polymerase III subunit chi
MTQIDFYVDCASPFDTVSQLCRKARERDWTVRILTRSEEETRVVDRYLWEHPQLGFLPHCRVGDPLQSETPIWIGEVLQHEGKADMLINLHDHIPPFFAQFLRLAEIISEEETSKQTGRERYRFYQDRGYPLNVHRLSKKRSS